MLKKDKFSVEDKLVAIMYGSVNYSVQIKKIKFPAQIKL